MTRPLLFIAVRHVLRSLSWRDLATAALIILLMMALAPGGYIVVVLNQGVNPILDPSKHYLPIWLEGTLAFGLPLVLAVRVANFAVDAGQPAWRSYAFALLAAGAWEYCFHTVPIPGFPAQQFDTLGLAFMSTRTLLYGSTGLVIYAHWRAARHSARLVRKTELRSALDAQRLQTARLLALQARVDPQTLFDTLRRVGTLHTNGEVARSDALLADLIALLRAVLPQGTTMTSDVEREFEVVDAWLRIAGGLSDSASVVRLRVAETALHAPVAPMLVLPLLRAALDMPGGEGIAWQLGAHVLDGRLLVVVDAVPGDAAAARVAMTSAALVTLQERLFSLHGGMATLSLTRAPFGITMALPTGLVSAT